MGGLFHFKRCHDASFVRSDRAVVCDRHCVASRRAPASSSPRACGRSCRFREWPAGRLPGATVVRLLSDETVRPGRSRALASATLGVDRSPCAGAGCRCDCRLAASRWRHNGRSRRRHDPPVIRQRLKRCSRSRALDARGHRLPIFALTEGPKNVSGNSD